MAINNGDKAMIEMIMSRRHVGESVEDVRAYWQGRIDKCPAITEKDGKAIIRHALKCHADNGQLYSFVMNGR